MPKYSWMCLNKQDPIYVPGSKCVKILWIWQSSDYGRVFNMRELHSVVNMPEYALADFWIFLGFYLCQDFEYSRVPNVQELDKILNMP